MTKDRRLYEELHLDEVGDDEAIAAGMKAMREVQKTEETMSNVGGECYKCQAEGNPTGENVWKGRCEKHRTCKNCNTMCDSWGICECCGDAYDRDDFDGTCNCEGCVP